MSKRAKIALTLLALAGLAFVAIPNLLSTTIVRERLERQLSDITGRKVMLNGGSRISIRPYLGVTYDDVTIADDRDQPGKPLVTIDGLRAKLGLLGALWGDARLAELELVRPHFNLRRDGAGNSNWSTDQGEVANLLANPTQEAEPSLALGSIRIEEGIVTYRDELANRVVEITALNGSLDWPNISSASAGNFSWVWNGEVTNFRFEMANPYDFLSGGESQLRSTLAANPGELTFSGSVNRGAISATGEMSLTTASPRRLLDWCGLNLPAMQKLDALEISGPMSFINSGVEFPDAKLTVADHAGEGRLQLMLDKHKGLNISGTLAFDTLSLPIFRSAVPAPGGASNNDSALDASMLGGLTVDLRLSAQSAQIGSINIDDLAASALIRNGTASFDIGDGKALGGTVAGSVEVQTGNDGISAHTSATLTGIDLGALTGLIGGSSITLSGSGDLKFKLRSGGKIWEDMMMRLNGDGRITSRNGTLTGLDFSDILNSVKSGTDSVVRLSSQSTKFTKLDMGFFVANGTAFLRDSSMETGSLVVSLKGRSDLVDQSLALRGDISPVSDQNSDSVTLPFFIGGTLSSPLFVPLPAAARERLAAPVTEKQKN